jgi:Reverse transcriptase (RNA-dependent DNA polymerase)
MIFTVKNLGPISNYLGIEITRKNGEISLNQKDYIQKILKRFKIEDLNPVTTSMDSKFDTPPLNASELATKEDITWYQTAISSLLYAALAIRPDIAYAVSTLGRYTSNPSEYHQTAVKRLFRYLKGTINYGIKYSKREYLTGYSDSDYAEEKGEYKSTSGYIFFLGNGPISYQSKL